MNKFMKQLALCLAIGLSTPIMANTVTFSDVEAHWAQSNIEELAQNGVFGGYTDGTFKPNNGITRAELAALLTKLFDLEAPSAEIKFADIAEDAWYSGAIMAVTELGYMNTFFDGNFYPSQLATRQEVAYAIVQAYQLQDIDANINLDTTFTDTASISAWAEDAIAILVSHELLSGYSDGTLNPTGNITRAEIATLLNRVINSNLVNNIPRDNQSGEKELLEAFLATYGADVDKSLLYSLSYTPEITSNQLTILVDSTNESLIEIEDIIKKYITFEVTASDEVLEGKVYGVNNTIEITSTSLAEPQIIWATISSDFKDIDLSYFEPVKVGAYYLNGGEVTPAGSQAQVNYVLAFAREVCALVNVERAKEGLAPLQFSEELSGVSQAKAEDMAIHNTLSHTSPVYGSMSDLYNLFDISWTVSAGENIAQGYISPAEVVEGWMNSDGHRSNMLSESFTIIGVGYEPTGRYWTQNFVGGLK
ncbi:MAG: hypothetical protein BEN18_02775 [Epulopiscium sp. Nuni2H_MBin001]|nr:MAG: hypothetical protein BEN18_02775 [Epulopiscium sp. Nuni2H_MBin001]